MKINAAFNRLPNSEAISLYSAVMENSDTGLSVLVIAKGGKFNPKTSPDFFLITDNPMAESYDSLFREEDFKAGFEAYQYLKASGRIVIDDGIQEYNIDNAMEISKQRANGQAEYNIDMLQNGHMALIATCKLFHSQISMETSIETYDELDSLYQTI